MKRLRQIQPMTTKTSLPITSKIATTPPSSPKHPTTKACTRCNGLGYLLVDNWTAKECDCLEQERLQRRFRNSRIPVELEQASLHNYFVRNKAQKTLYQAATEYSQHFAAIQQEPKHSLGFLAEVGEQTLRSIQDVAKKRRMKTRHNNMGIGKSHLQIAIAKKLIQQGMTVLVISDVAWMDELMQRKANSDQETREQIETLTTVPVLIWDDLGKSHPTEAKQSVYFQVIDARYRNRKPMLFSSNEDLETLAYRIGDAAASRLYGMSRLYAVEGPDYRQNGQ